MVDVVGDVLRQTLLVSLEAAPWILAGLLATALFKAFVRPQRVERSIGTPGLLSAAKAALIGAPLPMCSCGVLPAALALHEGGASRGATISFLVSVPETNPESVVVSWGMLGPALSIMRPVTALFAALAAGTLVDRFGGQPTHAVPREAPVHGHDHDACCAHDHGTHEHAHAATRGERLREGMYYAFTDVVDDIAKWIAFGLLVAGIITATLPEDFLGNLGNGPIAILVALIVSVPLYVCASGSVPLGAAMLFAGASPGVVLAFLLAGPATNVATMGAVRRVMGSRVMWIYAGTIAATAFAAGMIIDALWPLIASLPGATHSHVHVGDASHAHSWIPLWLMWGSLAILAAAAIRPWRRMILRPLTRKAAGAT